MLWQHLRRRWLPPAADIDDGRVHRVRAWLQARIGADLPAGAFATLSLRFAHLALEFLALMLLARLLDSGAFGVYAVAMTCAMVLGVPATAGFDRLLVREVAAHLAGERWGLLHGVLQRATQFAMTSSILLSVALAILAVVIGNLRGQALGHALLLAAAYLPLIAFARRRRRAGAGPRAAGHRDRDPRAAGDIAATGRVIVHRGRSASRWCECHGLAGRLSHRRHVDRQLAVAAPVAAASQVRRTRVSNVTLARQRGADDVDAGHEHASHLRRHSHAGLVARRDRRRAISRRLAGRHAGKPSHDGNQSRRGAGAGAEGIRKTISPDCDGTPRAQHAGHFSPPSPSHSGRWSPVPGAWHVWSRIHQMCTSHY